MKKVLDFLWSLYIMLLDGKHLNHSKHSKKEKTQMMKTRYNLSNIMKRAWQLFNATTDTFAECLKKAWADDKAFFEAIRKNLIFEEVHTWYGWKELGFEVIHESKNVFQITVSDPKTKSGTRVLSYFTKSQVVPLGSQELKEVRV